MGLIAKIFGYSTKRLTPTGASEQNTGLTQSFIFDYMLGRTSIRMVFATSSRSSDSIINDAFVMKEYLERQRKAKGHHLYKEHKNFSDNGKIVNVLRFKIWPQDLDHVEYSAFIRGSLDFIENNIMLIESEVIANLDKIAGYHLTRKR